MRMLIPLFSQGDLRTHLLSLLEKLSGAVARWNPDELLRTPDDDVVETLVDQFCVEFPVLHREDMHQLESVDLVVPTPNDFLGRTETHLTEITFVIPCSGNIKMFDYRPSTFQTNLGGGPKLGIIGSEIRVTWSGQNPEPQALLKSINRAVDDIATNVGHVRTQVAEHNRLAEQTARRLVSERRARLLADRKLQAALGIPVRRKSGPPAIPVPVTRKKVVPRRPQAQAASPFAPEYVLTQDDYEETIRVLGLSRSALERTPLTVAKLGEEDIRNILLVSLNCQFEGKAGGELFNGEGKTDILIRVDDRNVFIGECKIWSGPKAIEEAITQLLGYLVWRDSKAALLVFIREGEATNLIQKAIARIEGHPNHKHTLPSRESEGRYDFVVRANDDQERDIHLAFLPFVLPIKQAANKE